VVYTRGYLRSEKLQKVFRMIAEEDIDQSLMEMGETIMGETINIKIKMIGKLE